MKPSLSKIMLVLCAIVIASPVRAEVVGEATVGGGYQDNLFNDSNAAGDSYASLGLDLKYYPSASAQISIGSRYSAFSTYRDLSNLTSDASLIVIPTRASSPLSLALSGRATMRTFGPLYELYNQVGASVGADIGYRLSSGIFLRSSASYGSVNYVKAEAGSNHGLDLASAVNLTLPGSNSLAVEVDYTRRIFEKQASIQGMGRGTSSSSLIESETFEISGVIVRYSRPLGQRTGLNLSGGRRMLHLGSDYAAPGYSIDYLSPWTDLWDGSSFSGGLKHFFPAQFMAEAAVAYYDKSFVETVEYDAALDETYRQDSRVDQLTTLSLSLSRPVSLDSGKLFTPQLFIGYRINQSSLDNYDYDDIQVALSLRVGL